MLFFQLMVSHSICYNDLLRESRCAYKNTYTHETYIRCVQIGMICTGAVKLFFSLKLLAVALSLSFSSLLCLSFASICVIATYCVHCLSFCLPSSILCILEFVSVDQVNDANGFFPPLSAYYGVNI